MGDRNGLRHKIDGFADAFKSRTGLSLGSEPILAVYLAFFVLINFAGVSILSPSAWAPYTTANSNAPNGALWVEDSELHWADGSIEYWVDNSESTIETTSPGGPNGAAWVEGSNLHWIDQNGDERYYSAGDTGNNPSATNGAAWLENGVFHYIDENGNERWSSSWRESFEDGNLNEWNVQSSNFQIKTNYVYSGSYSAGAEVSSGQTNMGEVTPNMFSGGVKPSEMSFRYLETSTSHGGGMGLYDGSGNIVTGYATDNPQWVVWDGGSWNQIYNGDGYTRWVEVTYTFDWANGQYDYRIRDPSSGIIKTGTANLGSTNGITKFAIKNDAGFDGTSGFDGGNDFNMWFDAISIEW